MIQTRSGHQRLESMRTYERVTSEQEKAVSTILSFTERVDYRSALKASEVPPQAPPQLQQPPAGSSNPIIIYSGCIFNVTYGHNH